MGVARSFGLEFHGLQFMQTVLNGSWWRFQFTSFKNKIRIPYCCDIKYMVFLNIENILRFNHFDHRIVNEIM